MRDWPIIWPNSLLFAKALFGRLHLVICNCYNASIKQNKQTLADNLADVRATPSQHSFAWAQPSSDHAEIIQKTTRMCRPHGGFTPLQAQLNYSYL